MQWRIVCHDMAGESCIDFLSQIRHYQDGTSFIVIFNLSLVDKLMLAGPQRNHWTIRVDLETTLLQPKTKFHSNHSQTTE